MRYSQLFVRTSRLAPREADSPGSQFLLRGGFAARSGQSGNVLLPMGMRVRQRLSRLVEDRLQSLAGQPLQLGHSRGSAERHDKQHVLTTAPLCHPVWFWCRRFGAAASQVIQSYRQLPVCLYAADIEENNSGVSPATWIDTLPAEKLVGCYLAASRDSISDGLAAVSEVLGEVCELSGVDATWVAAGRDASGDVDLHRLVVVGLGGDRPLLRCTGCGAIEAAASAGIRTRLGPTETRRPMREIATPGCKTILDLCQYLELEPFQTAKAIFLMAQSAEGQQEFIIAVVRGDTDFNPDKLARRVGAEYLRPATEAEIRRACEG